MCVVLNRVREEREREERDCGTAGGRWELGSLHSLWWGPHRDAGGTGRRPLWPFKLTILLLALQLRQHFKVAVAPARPTKVGEEECCATGNTHKFVGNQRETLSPDRNVPGHAAQSADFCICGPAHWAPPFKGIGLVQVRVRLRPWLGFPLHLHSRQGLQALQPPLTAQKERERNGQYVGRPQKHLRLY